MSSSVLTNETVQTNETVHTTVMEQQKKVKNTKKAAAPKKQQSPVEETPAESMTVVGVADASGNDMISEIHTTAGVEEVKLKKVKKVKKPKPVVVEEYEAQSTVETVVVSVVVEEEEHTVAVVEEEEKHTVVVVEEEEKHTVVVEETKKTKAPKAPKVKKTETPAVEEGETEGSGSEGEEKVVVATKEKKPRKPRVKKTETPAVEGEENAVVVKKAAYKRAAKLDENGQVIPSAPRKKKAVATTFQEDDNNIEMEIKDKEETTDKKIKTMVLDKLVSFLVEKHRYVLLKLKDGKNTTCFLELTSVELDETLGEGDEAGDFKGGFSCKYFKSQREFDETNYTITLTPDWEEEDTEEQPPYITLLQLLNTEAFQPKKSYCFNIEDEARIELAEEDITR